MTENLERKVDDLTRTVNRLSQQLDDYEPSSGVKKRNKKKDEEVDDFGTDFSKDENEERGNWSGRLDFLLACLGYAVGLGNVWRFPYLCYKNGGAVFFIPYVIMLTFVGIPIFFLELSIGQFTSRGPLNCWQCANIFKGVGVAMVIVSTIVGIYYNMIIAWALYYLFASFTSQLPWEKCTAPWATEWCRDYITEGINEANCTAQDFNVSMNGACYNGTQPYGIWNSTLAKDNKIRVHLASEDYLHGHAWGKSDSSGIDDIGGIRWQMALCLLLAWIIVCLSLIKGIKSSGKVVYFTALFPYCVLIILLVRGLTLDGYYEGIEFYILTPDLSKLKDATVWKDAAVQIFFSLSASWGGLIALASYNRFHNDCLRDTLIVSIGNCLTSFFAGFVIFSFLGFLAKEMNTTVDQVAESGIGLAFIVYPTAVTLLPVSPLWSILFFMMLITLGLDSEFALVETLTTSIFDQWPKTMKYKSVVVIIVGICGYLLGLTMCTNGGAFMLQLVDSFAGGWNVLVICLCECICVVYVYGFKRFKEDIRCMVGDRPCCCFPWTICQPWWAACWYFFTPAGVIFILIFSWVSYSPATYGDYTYPLWAEVLGWLMTMVVVISIFLTAFIMICITPGSFRERMRKLTSPTAHWGPALPKHRRLCLRYAPDFIVDPDGEDKNDMDMEEREGGYKEQGGFM